MSAIAPRAIRAACLLAAAGCGGAGSGATHVNADGVGEANIAATAHDPRSGDLTGQGLPPPPPPAPKGTSSANPTGLTTPEPGGGAPSSSASKKDVEPPQRIGARHVLIQWMGSERAPTSVVRSREQALTTVQLVLKRARAGEDFARLAVEFSDEPGAASRGGSLGRFGHGQMVPAFEAVVFKLEVGQISDIVETSFGYHVIQRTE